MCCFKSRKTPACIVFVLSFLATVAGAAMVYFAVAIHGSRFMNTISDLQNLDEQINLKNIRQLIFTILLIFALVAILAAIMGMVACKIQHRCYTICYGCILLPTWIIVIVVGAIAVYFSVLGKETIKTMCDQTMAKVKEDQKQREAARSSGSLPSTGDPCDDKVLQNAQLEV